MKKLLLLTTIISSLGIISCNPGRNLAPITEITGQWEAIEYHYNIGVGPDQIKKLDPGYIYTFNDDLSFTLSTSTGCDKGNFTDEEGILTLTYTCSNVEKIIQFRYRIFDDILSMSDITGSICTEGCSTKYRYIRD